MEINVSRRWYCARTPPVNALDELMIETGLSLKHDSKTGPVECILQNAGDAVVIFRCCN